MMFFVHFMASTIIVASLLSCDVTHEQDLTSYSQKDDCTNDTPVQTPTKFSGGVHFAPDFPLVATNHKWPSINAHIW